jgi:hypothetical protein
MGQPITVSVRAGANPAVRFFDCNRSLTGMAIEVYESAAEANGADAAEPGTAQRGSHIHGDRPPDVLAKRLFEVGATKVTVYSNVAVVEAAPDAWADAEPKMVHILEHLFEFYGDNAGWSFEARGMEPQASKVQ